MPKVKLDKLPQAEFSTRRNALLEKVEAGELSIPATLLEIRLLLGMTQAEFAERFAKVSRKTYAKIESGQQSAKVEVIDACLRPLNLQLAPRIKPKT